MSNPLTDVLPPGGRTALYVGGWTTGVGLGATSAGYAAIGGGLPQWLIVALAVYAFLAGSLGFPTAQANVGR